MTPNDSQGRIIIIERVLREMLWELGLKDREVYERIKGLVRAYIDTPHSAVGQEGLRRGMESAFEEIFPVNS